MNLDASIASKATQRRKPYVQYVQLNSLHDRRDLHINNTKDVHSYTLASKKIALPNHED